MKFVCDRCGKRFASVDEPAPGRVYRIRCRCGHVILVRGPASTTAARAADPKLSRFEPPPPPPPLPAPLEGEREDVRTAPERATEAARPGHGSLASPGADGGGEARAVAPGPARHAELAPREEQHPAPAPALDETEPEVSDDPFLRAANEAAPIAPAPDAAASGGAALAASLAASELGARHERPPLSLGLDDAGGGAGRRVLFAGIIALLAALAAAVVWRM